MNNKKEILLINRDEDFLRQTAVLLGQAGYTVHTETEMRGALSALSAHPVGLIICDKDLQDISGYDFLNFIKKDPLREATPFIFFVPLKDQGRPFKAFELGATDFLVYPMDGEHFLKRIKEIFPLDASEKAAVPPEISATAAQDPLSSQTACLPPTEKRLSQGARPLPFLDIDVSRDGVLWMPGRIKDFSSQEIFVETALFGKKGVSLMLRFSVPEDNTIVMGRIQNISFDDFQSPTGISIEIEQDMVWEKILSSMNSVQNADVSGPVPNHFDTPVNPVFTSADVVRVPTQSLQETAVYSAALDPAMWTKEPSCDTRFYDSLVGKQLNNYRTITFIGSGSMGGVFQSWDVVQEMEVALKVIYYKLSSQETFRETFINEARMVSRLSHPNIIQIYDVGSSNDILYYAMEFIDGSTLADLIRQHQTLNTLKGVNYLTTICQALDFANRKQIIHWDIKPESIMICNEGSVKIVDFGVAQISDIKNLEQQQEVSMGSPLFLSPDCLAGRALDHRSHIYSLGATFYYAFTGHPPFEGDNIQDILNQHLNHELTPLREKNPKVPNALGKIIEKMMAKDPKNRYQDYQSIINDLKTLRFRALKLIRNRS